MLHSVIVNQNAIVGLSNTEKMRPSKENILNVATSPNAATVAKASADGDFRAGMIAITPYLQTIAIGVTCLEGDLASLSNVSVVFTHILQ